MPHYRCPPCRTRRRLPDVPRHEVGHLCPDCGSLLDPVSELVELVGFREVGRASPSVPPGHEAVTVRIEELLVRRALVREHDRQQALLTGAIDDEPPEPSAAAGVALPLPTR